MKKSTRVSLKLTELQPRRDHIQSPHNAPIKMPEDLAQYAAILDMNVLRLVNELQAGVHAPRVREDFLAGVRAGVNGTPTFFINGERFDGVPDFDSLLAALTQFVPGYASAAHRDY